MFKFSVLISIFLATFCGFVIASVVVLDNEDNLDGVRKIAALKKHGVRSGQRTATAVHGDPYEDDDYFDDDYFWAHDHDEHNCEDDDENREDYGEDYDDGDREGYDDIFDDSEEEDDDSDRILAKPGLKHVSGIMRQLSASAERDEDDCKRRRKRSCKKGRKGRNCRCRCRRGGADDKGNRDEKHDDDRMLVMNGVEGTDNTEERVAIGIMARDDDDDKKGKRKVKRKCKKGRKGRECRRRRRRRDDNDRDGKDDRDD